MTESYAEARVPRISGAIKLGVLASTLLAYLALLAVGVAAHEPWFDEAQAWLLARDASVWELLTRYLRYEGHPPLWYLILTVPAKLGLPYKSINLVSAAIGTTGVVLLLLRGNLPLVVRVLVPFGFFVAYQYTIVSRSYVLILPLLLGVLAIYPERRRRLWLFVALLVLLCHVSLHGASLAGGLALLYAFETLRDRAALTSAEWRRHGLAAVVLVLNVVVMALILYPAPDLAIRARLNFGFSPVTMLSRGWWCVGATMLGPGWSSLGLLIVLGVWLYRRRTLAVGGVLVAALLPISTVYFNYWHEGLFFLALLFTFLLTLERVRAEPAEGRVDRVLDRVALVVICAWLALHAYWTYQSYRYDLVEAYSASAEAAQYVAEQGLDRGRLYGVSFPSLALQPYFAANLYANYETHGGFSFWDWSERSPWFFGKGATWRAAEARTWIRAQLDQEPDAILVSAKFDTDQFFMNVIEEDGHYRTERDFFGALFWKSRIIEGESYRLYRRVDQATPATSPAGSGE